MTMLKPQTALGGFALITLLLAGAAVGRVLGVSFGEALYLTGLLLVGLGWLGNRVLLRRCAHPSEDREA
jgi:putative Mn2+ efflux pump MntP